MSVVFHTTRRIYAGLKIIFRSAGTDAKFKIKSSLLLLWLNKVTSARKYC